MRLFVAAIIAIAALSGCKDRSVDKDRSADVTDPYHWIYETKTDPMTDQPRQMAGVSSRDGAYLILYKPPYTAVIQTPEIIDCDSDCEISVRFDGNYPVTYNVHPLTENGHDRFVFDLPHEFIGTMAAANRVRLKMKNYKGEGVVYEFDVSDYKPI